MWVICGSKGGRQKKPFFAQLIYISSTVSANRRLKNPVRSTALRELLSNPISSRLYLFLPFLRKKSDKKRSNEKLIVRKNTRVSDIIAANFV